MRFRKLIKCVALCALILCAVPILSSMAMGSLITYTNVSVGNLVFQNIEENTTNSAIVAFGQPQGGSSFTLPNYVLNSSSVMGTGGGTDSTAFSTTISSTTDYIQSINFGEGGNFFLTSFGAAATSASIASTGSHLVILEENGVPITPVTINPTLGDFTHTFTQSGAGTSSNDWSGNLSFNMVGLHATKVSLVLDNVVDTTSTATSVAFLGGAKTSLSMNFTLAPVPEPSSIILLSMGALAVVFLRKRAAR